MAFFTHDLGDGYDLVLRDLASVDEVLTLTHANIDRLRAWEPWAQGEQTRPALVTFTKALIADWVDGRNLPTLLRFEGRVIGSVTCRIDRQPRLAEIGYWIDAEFEGRGAVTRACRAVVDYLAEQGTERIEIRAAAGNARSRHVAERLGFTLETVRPKAFPVAGVRHDQAVYVLRTGGAGTA